MRGDLFLHAPVAIKFMSPQFLSFPGAVQRFVNERRASALINSDHVVPMISNVGKTPSGSPFLVMESLEGRDLSAGDRKRGSAGTRRSSARFISFSKCFVGFRPLTRSASFTAT